MRRFGSTEANIKNIRELYEHGVHADVTLGLWYASLSGGLTALVDAQTAAFEGQDAATKASRSIGRGKGVVREVRFGLSIAGNEAYFDYLSDELLELAQEQVDKQVDNPAAKRVLRQLVGELRPDLKSWFGPDAIVWVKGEYGKFQGAIDNAYLFASRDGKPYFGAHSEGWTTSYFGFEAGFFPDGRQASAETKRDEATFLYGFYGRYRRFSRPLVLGFSVEDRPAQFLLHDGDVTAIEFGMRVQIAKCSTFCGEFEGSMAPFTGITLIDIGQIGNARAGIFAFGAAGRVSLPISITKDVYFAPYLGLRAESLLPLIAAGSTDPNAPSFPMPDYFFWGPTAGLIGRL